jgi:outer membrane murein-binding lipoprotein Lpp
MLNNNEVAQNKWGAASPKNQLIGTISSIQEIVLILASNIAIWAAPIVPIAFIAKAIYENLWDNIYVAIMAGITVETVGIAAIKTALWCYNWNKTKPEKSPSAPTVFSVMLATGYFIAGLILSIGLEIYPPLVKIAPGILFCLTAIAYGSLLISTELNRWEGERSSGRLVDRLARQVKKLGSQWQKLTSQINEGQKRLSGITSQITKAKLDIGQLSGQRSELQAEVDQLKKAKANLTEVEKPKIARQKLPAKNGETPKQTEIRLRQVEVKKLKSQKSPKLTVAQIAKKLGEGESTIKGDIAANKRQNLQPNGKLAN